MKVIRFELHNKSNNQDKIETLVEVSLDGDTIDSYLQAFKAFLQGCGFVENTISEIQIMEDARFKFLEEKEEKI
jgi:hypothetical protein